MMWTEKPKEKQHKYGRPEENQAAVTQSGPATLTSVKAGVIGNEGDIVLDFQTGMACLLQLQYSGPCPCTSISLISLHVGNTPV